MSRRTDWAAGAAERDSLADLLGGLAPSEWAVHSLCPGWRVRDVAAHLTARPGQPDERSPEQLVADLRRPGHAWGFRPAPAQDALVEVLVHGQDIARPLGRPRPVDPQLAAHAARRVWSAPPFRAARRFPDLRFEATDAGLALGDGATVSGPASALLLVLAGRTAGLDEVSGHGAGLLQRAFQRPS